MENDIYDFVKFAFDSYIDNNKIDTFTQFTMNKYFPSWLKDITHISMRLRRYTLWISKNNKYARIDIFINSQKYRIFLIKNKTWLIENIVPLLPTKYIHNGICVLKNETINGLVYFSINDDKVQIDIEIKGLNPGRHAIHIHECGDLTDNCNSACAHFNPTHQFHGGIDDNERHVGDLGNIVANRSGICRTTLYDSLISLNQHSPNYIIGRSVIIHEDPDDNRSGVFEDSHTTGHAGKRIVCGVIGIAKPN